jgi:hypothetical protein
MTDVIQIFNCNKCEDQKQFYVQVAFLEPILIDCDECNIEENTE